MSRARWASSPYRTIEKRRTACSVDRLTVTTPTFQALQRRVEVNRAEVPRSSPRRSEGHERRARRLTLGLRPTSSIRIEASTVYSRITRARDGSEFARTVIPRVKVEYQPTRALFFRVVGEYRSERQDALLDPLGGGRCSCGGGPRGPEHLDGLRMDLLLSYEPTPGTVAFFGYGSSLETERQLSVRGLRRQQRRVLREAGVSLPKVGWRLSFTVREAPANTESAQSGSRPRLTIE